MTDLVTAHNDVVCFLYANPLREGFTGFDTPIVPRRSVVLVVATAAVASPARSNWRILWCGVLTGAPATFGWVRAWSLTTL